MPKNMDYASLGKTLVVRPIVYSSILFPEITLTDLGMDMTKDCGQIVKYLFVKSNDLDCRGLKY